MVPVLGLEGGRHRIEGVHRVDRQEAANGVRLVGAVG